VIARETAEALVDREPPMLGARVGQRVHFVNVVHDLNARGVGLRVLTGQGSAIDTTSAAGNLF
jgi:hypothetical protein